MASDREGGYRYNLLHGPSLYDQSPAVQKIAETTAPFQSIKRKFIVSSVDVETGDYCAFNDENITFEELPKATMASASLPGVFAPMHLHGKYLMDGGTVWNTNVNSAVQMCRDMGFEDHNIVVDAFTTHYYDESREEDPNNAMENWLISHSLHKFYNGNNALE